MEAEVEVPDSERCKGTIKTRFSTLRFKNVVKKFVPVQLGYITKYRLGHLLNFPDHLIVPIPLTQWIVDHIPHGSWCFKHKSKVINFHKDMVNIVFGLPSGNVPFVFKSSDPDIVDEVQELRSKYVFNGKITMERLVQVLLADYSEDGFIRSFVLFFLSTILCPVTYNSVKTKYLYSLRDVSLIPNLDFGTLCITHLFREIDKFHDKVFDVDTVAEFNRKLWVGGCLPLLTIVYMDFLHFPNGGGPNHMGVPRIQHVVSADFVSVHNLNRKRTSRKSYGVLQIKDISQTPYAAIGIGAALPAPILVDIEEDEYVGGDDLIHEPIIDDAEVQPRNEEVHVMTHNATGTQDNLRFANPIDLDTPPNVVNRSDASVARDDGGSNAPIILDTPESENIISNDHTSDATIPRVSPSVNPRSDVAIGRNVSKNADVGSLIKGLLSKHESKWMGMNERAAKTMVTEIESVISAHCHGSGVVHHGLDNRSTSPLVENSDVALHIVDVIPPVGQQDSPVSKKVDPVTETREDIDSGLKIAMSYADIPSTNQVVDDLSIVLSPNPNCSSSVHVPIPSMDESTGQSTLDKRNRKKRAVKIVSPDPVVSKKVKVDADVDCFYTKFVRNKFFNTRKSDLSPDFIDFGDFTVPYEHFYNSHKPRGDVGDEVMCAYGKMFNLKEKLSSSPSKATKYIFSPYLSSKLIQDPDCFDMRACVREISRISSEINLATIDLMHFPIILPHHWVLACVNSLFSSINFFDSVGSTSVKVEDKLLNNLVTNLNTVFQELHIDSKNLPSFKKFNPSDYPWQTTLHDCGFYVLMYIEHWTGKVMVEFSQGPVLHYRMNMAYGVFQCEANKIKIGSLDALKKRKKM